MMPGRTLLFAGPSLPDPPIALPPHIEVRPPARCGDMLRALEDGIVAMALVDGVFETGPTTWHKEILYLMSRGIRVFGAASLGALRAAELCRFGMTGVGAIYEAYRDGSVIRDDAVMVLHAPGELAYRPMTLALVDAEASISAADLDAGDRAALLRIARRTGFRDRTWARLIHDLAIVTGPRRAAVAASALRQATFSQKCRDVAMLIDRLATPSTDTAPPCPYQLPHTRFLEVLLACVDADEKHIPAAARPSASSWRSRSR